LRYRPFFGKEGGVTLSGGEPLLQAAFSADLLKQCQEAGVHTALDTAGSIFHEDVTNVLNYSDLVILDVKHTDPLEYKKLTGGNYSVFEQFLDHCIKIKKPLWLRQVIVPGFTDGIDNIRALANLAKKAESRKVELLPYHDMGKYKWNQLGISYALDRITPPSDATMQELKKELLDFL
jgi:pyruvate formate lyase activating enzyme